MKIISFKSYLFQTSLYYPWSYFRDARISVSPCLSHHNSKRIKAANFIFTHVIHKYVVKTLYEFHKHNIEGVETRRPFPKGIVKKRHSRFREKIESTHF